MSNLPGLFNIRLITSLFNVWSRYITPLLNWFFLNVFLLIFILHVCCSLWSCSLPSFLVTCPFLFSPHCCCNPPSMHTVACQLHGFLLEPHPLCVCVCVCVCVCAGGKKGGGGWLFHWWLLIRMGHSTNKWWLEGKVISHACGQFSVCIL